MRGKRKFELFKRIAMPLGLAVFVFSIIALNVTAASSPFKIVNAEITAQAGGVDAVINDFEETNINSTATFYQLGGSITYAVDLQNTTDKSYKITAITDNNSNPYLSYSYSDHAGEEVAAGGNLVLDVTVTYANEIPSPEDRIQNFGVKFLLDYEEIVEEPVEPDTPVEPTEEDIDVPNTDVTVPDTGVNTIAKNNANPAFVVAAIIGALLIAFGLVKSKLSTRTKAVVLAILGTFAITSIVSATNGDFTFEITNNYSIKDLLYVTTNVDGTENKTVVAYGGTLTISEPQKNGYTFAGWEEENGVPFNPAAPIMDDTKIKAVFSLDTYNISYDLKGGVTAAENVTEYNVHDNITLVEPTKDDYDFTGWTGTDLTEPTKNVVIPAGSTGDRSYTANYAPVTYQVSYDNLTPEEIIALDNPLSYNIESEPRELHNPVNRVDGDGDVTQTFVGWKDGDTISTTVNLPNPNSMGDKLFVAQWVDVAPTVYTITYELNDGVTETENITEFTKEHETFTLINPTKTGYQFKGWSGTGLTGDANTTVQVVTGTRENLSFEAHYTPNTYNVVFDGNGATGTMGAQVFTYDVTANLNANLFVKTGYHFTGWNTAANGSGSVYGNGAEVKNLKSSGEITLYAQWEANPYEIIFVGNHDRVENSMSSLAMTYGKAKTLPLNMFQVLGCVFESWNTAADGNGTRYENGASVSNLATGGTVALYAQWAVTPYTIVYNKNHTDAVGTMGTQEVEYAQVANLLTNKFTRTGYTFGGWNTAADGNGTHYDDQAMVMNLAVNGTVNLYAEWQANNYYIAFDKNHDNATGSMDNIEMTYNTSAVLPQNTFARDGYLFNGWNTDPSGNGVAYVDGATVINLATTESDVVTLYAQWTPAPYTIVFHGNGDDVTGTMADLTATYDTPVTLTKNVFRKLGYVFTNWNTDPDGNGESINDEAEVINLTTGGTIDLYAEWRIAEAMFKPGLYVNNQMRYLSGGPMNYGISLGNETAMSNNTGYLANPKVTAVKQSLVEPDFDHMNVWTRFSEDNENYDPDYAKVNDWNIVSTANSLDPIYIWYVPNDENNTNGVIYYWSYDTTPQLNKNAKRMFEDMNALAEIDYLAFDTTGVEQLANMFMTNKITSVDFSNFDTTNLLSIRGLLSGCTELTSVTFGQDFDTSKVTDFNGVFDNNRSLTSLDISMFDTRKATTMQNLFRNAAALETIVYGENFKTDTVKNFASMYEGVASIDSLDIIETFNTSSATNMNAMFKNDKVASINVAGFDTTNVTDMGSMFMNMDNLSTLDIHNFDTRKVKDMSYMFRGLKNITTHPIVGENFKTIALQNMQGMYMDYSNNVTSIDLTDYDTSNVTNMAELFRDNPQLTSVKLHDDRGLFVTNKVTTFANMFRGDTGMRTIPDLEWFDTSSAVNMSYMFTDMKVEYLDLSHFDTSKVTSMMSMFEKVTTDADLDFSSFTTPALVYMNFMFSNFSTPYKLDLHTFNTVNVKEFDRTFNGTHAPYLDISNFNMSSNKLSQMMFHGLDSEIMDIGKFESNGNKVGGMYFFANSTLKTVLVDPDYVPNFSDVLGLVYIVGGQGTTYMGVSGEYGRIDRVEDGGEPGYFTDRTKYTIKYHINTDDTNVSGTMDNQVMAGGVTTALNANGFTRLGYKFGGWNTKADLTGTHYDDGQEISGYGTLHLYAEWGITPYTVVFDKNSTEATGTMESISKGYGEWFDLPQNEFARTHYKFTGWNTQANGRGKHYDNGEHVINLDVDGEITLYAEWLESTAVFRNSGANDGLNKYIKDVANNAGDTASHGNNTVKKFIRSSVEPGDDVKTGKWNKVSASNSNLPIYIWFEESTGTIYWWTEAETVFLPEHSENIFANLNALESVDIEQFDTTLATNMSGMFKGDAALQSIDLSNFDTSNVTDMNNMFFGCRSLSTLDVSGFVTDKVTDMSSMFMNVSGVESLNVTGFSTNLVKNFANMFSGMTSLTSLDVSGFVTDNATQMNSMFKDCEKLETINVSGFNTAKVTNFESMFRGCKSVTELDVSEFVTSNATSIGGMFYNCNTVSSLDVTNFDTRKVTNLNHTFLGLTNVTELDLSSFDTANVTGMQYTFAYSNNLKTIYVSDKFVTSAVGNSQLMFYSCVSLKGGAGTTFNGQAINHSRAHIDGGPDDPGYFTDIADKPAEP